MNTYSFDTRKEQVVHKITASLIDALEKDEIDDLTASKIAQYILLTKETIKDDTGLMAFVDDLAQTFDFFKNAGDMLKKSAEFSTGDEQKLDDVKKQLEMLSQKASNAVVN